MASRWPNGPGRRSVHATGKVTRPIGPPSHTNTNSAPARRRSKITAKRCPARGWNGWVTTTESETGLDRNEPALCRDRWDPETTDLSRRLWDRLLPHPLGNEPVGLEDISQPAEQYPSTEDNGARCHPIDAGGSCSLVAPHLAPRNNEERRVIDQVGKVIEATARIGCRPLVQLRLHHEYPAPASSRSGHGSPIFTSDLLVEQRHCEHAGPLRHVAGFPGLGTTTVLRPSRRHRPATGLPVGQPPPGRGGDRRDGSHVHSRIV